MDRHWHVGYYEDDHDVEAVAFRRLEDGLWDIYFADWLSNQERDELGRVGDADPIFGDIILHTREEDVEQQFTDWVKKVLLPSRR
ncbi:DUF3986 family protein [Paenibacillus sp. GCM10023252]|uniref:DUF3986 family protein n=1 Tax=Paenibacillus sp. GCM10023252 TaxID=3252649 RepID=UPI003617DF10